MIFKDSADDRKVRVFSLSQPFLDTFKDLEPDWGPLGLFVFKRCVTVETPVLCDDLVWRPAGGLKEGQGILGFDADAEKFRHVRQGVVLHNKTEMAETVGIELENGDVLYATPDHPWLVRQSKTNSRLMWRESKDLTDTQKGDVQLLRPFGPVWAPDTTYEGGFLAAAFDGEGCFDRLNSLSFIQVDNPMLRKVVGLLDQRRIPYVRKARKAVEGRQQCYILRINGRVNFLPVLGSLRPPRLLDVFQRNVERVEGDLGAFRCDPENYVKVVRVFPAGEREIAVLSTNLQTHFTGGYASHNTYARSKPDGSVEDWGETCQRVVEGCFNIQKIHCKQMGLPWNEPKAQKSAQEMFTRMWHFKFTPPGRGLWMMGTDLVYERGSAALQNCSFISSENIGEDFAGPFTYLMDLSMLGVGVGSDTRGSGKARIQTPKMDGVVEVEDSREGWVDLLKTVLNSFVGKGGFPAVIDYTKVRGRGEPIKGFGGTASGPGPLQEMIEGVTNILLPQGVEIVWDVSFDKATGKIGTAVPTVSGEGPPYRIDSAGIVDVFNFIGKCVVAGGVRRSAEIMFGEPDDEQFVTLKQDIEALNDRRWVSNNSVFGYVGMNYEPLVKTLATNGEPGIFWVENARRFGRMADPEDNKDWRIMGTNPCSEMALESGELCTLVETFPARHDSYEDYERTLKMAYLYAKTVTLVPTHDMRANAVMMRNRRIGCSMSGIIQAMVKLGRRTFLGWCNKGYQYIQRVDKVYSDWLGIPLSIKTTTVKPSGTVSLLMGSTPGIHYPHSEFYIRHVRVANTSILVQAARDAGYEVNADPYATDTSVVAFPVREEHYIKGKRQASMWEQFANTVDIQRHWADNQVSATISFKKEEIADIQPCLEAFEDQLKGISLLPLGDEDHGYQFAPYVEIDEEEYNRRMARVKPLNLTTAKHEVTERFCTSDTCMIG